MSSIKVSRSWNYLGIARAYKVMLNDQEIGRVKNNSSETFEVSPGTYEMKVVIGKFSG